MKVSTQDQTDKPKIGWRLLATFIVIAMGIGLLGLFSGNAHAAGLSQEAPNANATVNIAHYAPFGDSQDGTSVSIFVDGSEAITDVKFSDVKTGVMLPAGDHLIEIKPTGTDSVAISGTVTLAAGGSYTVMAIGDVANQPLGLKVLDNSVGASAEGDSMPWPRPKAMASCVSAI